MKTLDQSFDGHCPVCGQSDHSKDAAEIKAAMAQHWPKLIAEIEALLNPTGPAAAPVMDTPATAAELAEQIKTNEQQRAEYNRLYEANKELRRQNAELKKAVAIANGLDPKATAIKVAPDLDTQCFFALALGYFGRGKTLEEALVNLQKAGCKNTEPIAVDLFIGDDKPTVINGGLNIEYKHGALRIRIGLFKTLGAALRNLREP